MRTRRALTASHSSFPPQGSRRDSTSKAAELWHLQELQGRRIGCRLEI